MTVVFSTSSPLASVAVVEDGRLAASDSEWAPHGASGACLRMLDRQLRRLGRRLEDAELFVADSGPGSFTGLKVGVMLAKTLAFSTGVQAAGILSFDLFAPGRTVMIPNRRDEWHIRHPDQPPGLTSEGPKAGSIGYGSAFAEPSYPEAKNAIFHLSNLKPVPPPELVPTHFAEPRISEPRTPFGTGVRP